MSTKIYDGFRFVSSDLGEIHRALMAYRLVVAGQVRAAVHRHLAVEGSRKIDAAALEGVPCPHPLAGCHPNLIKRQRAIKATGHRDPEVDFEFSLAVMPFEGRVYGIVYCEQSDWVRAFLAQPLVEPFPYWNNTDAPDAVDEAAWQARGDLWRRLLDQDPGGRPCGCGFTADLSPADFWPEHAEILPHVPSRVERVARAARANVLDEVVKRGYDAVAEQGGKPDPLRIYLDADRVIRQGALADRLAEEAGRVEGILPEITLDMLTTGYVPSRQVAA